MNKLLDKFIDLLSFIDAELIVVLSSLALAAFALYVVLRVVSTSNHREP